MTLKDVATLAGCSVATVSKALKNSPEISEAVKSRIVAIAKESGYLKKATTHQAVLGGMKILLFCDARGTAASEFSVLYSTAKKYGLTLVYTVLPEGQSRELMAQIGAMGLLLFGTNKVVREERVFSLTEDRLENEAFIRQISEYRPKRPSRSGSGVIRSSDKEREKKTESTAKKEEIWLL